MEQTQIFKALEGVRGRNRVDLGKLERLLVRFSQLVLDLGRELVSRPVRVARDEELDRLTACVNGKSRHEKAAGRARVRVFARSGPGYSGGRAESGLRRNRSNDEIEYACRGFNT